MARTLALPLTVGAQGLASLVQNTPAELSQSVGLLLATSPGERRSVPEYGYESPLFAQAGPAGLSGARFSSDDAGVIDAVSDWEPRADPSDVEVEIDGDDVLITVHPAPPEDDTDGLDGQEDDT